MYLELIKNLELSKLTLLKETPIIEVMDGPVLPLEDKKIKPLVLITLFAFLAILFSSIYIVFRKMVVDSKWLIYQFNILPTFPIVVVLPTPLTPETSTAFKSVFFEKNTLFSSGDIKQII